MQSAEARSHKVSIAGAMFVLVLFGILLVPKTFATNPVDDQFGLSYDTAYGARTGYVPSSTQGIYMDYSDSTSGVTCDNSAGFITAVAAVTVAGGSPNNANLQASAALGCNGSNSDQWNIQWGYYDNNGNWHGGTSNYTLATLSTSTYSTISGYIEIYYTGTCWTEITYVSQVSTSYSMSGGCYPSTLTLGTTVSNVHDDWTNIETDPGNGGESLTALSFQVTSPEFYVSSSWHNWNQHSGSWYGFHAYADASVAGGYTNTNNIGTALLSSPGTKAQLGQSASDGTAEFWCISGSCPQIRS